MPLMCSDGHQHYTNATSKLLVERRRRAPAPLLPPLDHRDRDQRAAQKHPARWASLMSRDQGLAAHAFSHASNLQATMLAHHDGVGTGSAAQPCRFTGGSGSLLGWRTADPPDDCSARLLLVGMGPGYMKRMAGLLRAAGIDCLSFDPGLPAIGTLSDDELLRCHARDIAAAIKVLKGDRRPRRRVVVAASAASAAAASLCATYPGEASAMALVAPALARPNTALAVATHLCAATVPILLLGPESDSACPPGALAGLEALLRGRGVPASVAVVPRASLSAPGAIEYVMRRLLNLAASMTGRALSIERPTVRSRRLL